MGTISHPEVWDIYVPGVGGTFVIFGCWKFGGGVFGDSLLDGEYQVVFMYEKLDSWTTRLPSCIPELIPLRRKGKLSGSMF